jgi:hypothetical protein
MRDLEILRRINYASSFEDNPSCFSVTTPTTTVNSTLSLTLLERKKCQRNKGNCIIQVTLNRSAFREITQPL